MGFWGETMKQRVTVGVCALLGVLSLFTSGCGLARVNSRASPERAGGRGRDV
ncbi:MAG: hypothetical protein R3B07_18810 [Polyangiaceae bacterium]